MLKDVHKSKGVKFTEDHKRKIGLAHKGKPKNYPVWNKGLKMSKDEWKKRGFDRTGEVRTLEVRKKISDTMKSKREQLHTWKGGITPINHKIRKSFEYRLWRESVFQRDNWTCQWCGERGGKLNADHIKPFCDYPELRLAIDNGRTLCVTCHKKTDTFKINQFRSKDSSK